MTKTKKALLWLAQGKPRKDMEADLGLTTRQCTNLIDHLRVSGYIEPLPLTYSLTEKGKKRAEHAPKTKEKVLEVQREYQRKRYWKDRKEPTQNSVSHAVRTQPNSVFALGSGA